MVLIGCMWWVIWMMIFYFHNFFCGWFCSCWWIMRGQWWKKQNPIWFFILNYCHWHLWLLSRLQDPYWLSFKGNRLRGGDWFPPHHCKPHLAHHWTTLLLLLNGWNDMALLIGIWGMVPYCLGWLGGINWLIEVVRTYNLHCHHFSSSQPFPLALHHFHPPFLESSSSWHHYYLQNDQVLPKRRQHHCDHLPPLLWKVKQQQLFPLQHHQLHHCLHEGSQLGRDETSQLNIAPSAPPYSLKFTAKIPIKVQNHTK